MSGKKAEKNQARGNMSKNFFRCHKCKMGLEEPLKYIKVWYESEYTKVGDGYIQSSLYEEGKNDNIHIRKWKRSL